MKKGDRIRIAYNSVAGAYADELFNELAKKPLDCLLLTAFSSENKDSGPMIDLGCGPGQTTRFLKDTGIQNILGVDLSDKMIEKARQLSPDIEFQTADMLNLAFPGAHFGSAVAFYAIVHFNTDELAKAFSEIYRILKPGGQFLFSFHIGDNIIHRDEFFGEQVDIDFYFFKTEEVLELLKAAGYKVLNALERFPYEGVEYPSRRAYLWVEKAGA